MIIYGYDIEYFEWYNLSTHALFVLSGKKRLFVAEER